MLRPAIIAAGLLALAMPAEAAPHGVKIGVLTCNVDGGWGYFVGSSKDLRCRYHPNHGDDDRYVGSISKIGLDLGYTSSATLVWDVVAPTSDMRAGALEGDYGGATASATVAVGLGVHALLGGFDKSIALQPVSFESSSGLDIAAGIGALSLKVAAPEPVALDMPASPAAVSSRSPQTHYALWFDFDADHLSPSGRRAVAAAVRDAKANGVRQIVVTGHADAAGSDDYNQDLSLRRAESVRREMIRDGLTDTAIVIKGHGDRDLAVATPQGVRDPENRRVVITWRRDLAYNQ